MSHAAAGSATAVHAALDGFPPVRGHLDAATSGVPPLAAAAAAREAVAAWAEGRIDGPSYDAAVERSRAAFARLVGVGAEDVACGSHVSVFAGLVAAALEPGAEVLVARGDFTSVVFPMLVQAARGVQVREVGLADLPGAITARTALVAVSAVQSVDGRVLDLDALAAAADHHGAPVLLDVSQAAGWLPIAAHRFAYVVCGGYKWLLGPRGTAFLAVRPDAAERLLPHTAGWYAATAPWDACYGGPLRIGPGAKRLDVSPAWICWAGTAPAVELISELGAEAVGAYDLQLAARLRDGLGLAPYASPIVVVERPGAEQRLAAAGVRAVVRAGRVRLSCHLPATVEDVDRAVDALA
jgi:selenocysteine lyase/cysteine desulfurase